MKIFKNMTKKILTIVVLIICAHTVFSQSALYLKFADLEGVKSYYIADVDKLTGCTGCGFSNFVGDNLKQLLIHDIDLKRIKTVTILKSNNNEAMAKLRTEVINIVEHNDYELLVMSKDNKEKTSIYKKKHGNNEIIIMSDGIDEFVFKQLLGDFAVKK